MIGQSAGKTWTYLLGVYMGDGCVTRTADGYPVFRLNAIDEDFVREVQRSMKEMTTRPVWVGLQPVKGGKPQYQLRCGDPEICAAMVAQTGGKQHMPDLMGWSKEEKEAFAVGLMDSEGYVAEKTMTNKTGRAYYMGFKACGEWVRVFASMLQSIGLQIGKISDCPPLKPGYKTPTRFHIKMQSWIDSGLRMNIARKQVRIDRFKATVPYSERSLYPRILRDCTPGRICG